MSGDESKENENGKRGPEVEEDHGGDYKRTDRKDDLPPPASDAPDHGDKAPEYKSSPRNDEPGATGDIMLDCRECRFVTPWDLPRPDS